LGRRNIVLGQGALQDVFPGEALARNQRRDPVQASLALADAQGAQLLLGEEPGLMTTEMDCHHLIAKHGDSSERAARERRVKEIAMTILKSGDKPGNWWTAMYFADAEQPELALDAWSHVDLRDRALSQYSQRYYTERMTTLRKLFATLTR
jgi:hypothetical protein